MDIHEMEGHREGNVIIWDCPVCGRKVSLTPDVGIVTVEKGNQTVEHRQPISLTAVLEERMPDSFEAWAGENAERLFEADYPSP